MNHENKALEQRLVDGRCSMTKSNQHDIIDINHF